MPVSSEVSKSGPYTGNGVTTSFGYSFKIFDASHIRVVRTEAGVDTDLTTGFSVTGVGSNSGSVVFDVAPSATQKITLLRRVPQTQELDLFNQGAYFAEDIERALDLATMRDQQLQERLERAVTVPLGSTTSPETLIETLITASIAAVNAANEAAASAQAALEKANSMLRARGAWLTSTLYSPSDQFTYGGAVYLTVTEHTSTTVSADLGAGKIILWVDKGAAGTGSGDMLKAESLAGLADYPLALSRLGGQPTNANLTALAAETTTGIRVRTGAGTTALRSVVSTDGSIIVTNGDGVSGNITLSSQATFSAAVPTTSGTAHDVTGIPSTAREVEIYFAGNSLTGTNNYLVQLLVDGLPVTSGYTSSSGTSGVETDFSSGFGIHVASAARSLNGMMRLVRVGTGLWVQSHSVGLNPADANGGGRISGVGTVNGIRLTRTGADTFDAGSFYVSWR